MLRRLTFICLFILMFAVSSFTAEKTIPKVYIIIEIKIKDNELYNKYIEAVPSVVKKYGGKYLVRGDKVTPHAGNWNPERLIIIEFENMEQLQRCFNSPEYRELAPLRERSTLSKAVVVEGL